MTGTWGCTNNDRGTLKKSITQVHIAQALLWLTQTVALRDIKSWVKIHGMMTHTSMTELLTRGCFIDQPHVKHVRCDLCNLCNSVSNMLFEQSLRNYVPEQMLDHSTVCPRTGFTTARENDPFNHHGESQNLDYFGTWGKSGEDDTQD